MAPPGDGPGLRFLKPVRQIVTLGVFLASAGLFLVCVGLTGRLVVWIFEQLPR